MNLNSELSRRIRTAYPFPIAFTYDRLIQCLEGQDSPIKAVFLLRDCYESTVRYVALASVALYLHLSNSVRDIETDRNILEKLALPSTGTWVSLLERTAKMFQGCGHRLGEALYSSLFCEKRGQPKPGPTLDVLKKLVGFRNDMIGHGATMRDQEYQEVVEQEIQNLEAVSSYLTLF